MPDLSVTAANVVSSGVTQDYVAGATITAGQVVYQDPADSKVKLADANSGTADVRQPIGIALNGASDGQPIKVHTSGNIDVGATLTVGTIYVLSANAGGIAPHGDLTTGWYPSVLGVATAADNLLCPTGGPLVGTGVVPA